MKEPFGAPHHGGGHWAMLCLLALLWGTAFLFTRLAVGDVPPLTLVTVRVAVAGAVLHAVRIAWGLALPRGVAAWLRLLALSLSGAALPFVLISWGQITVASGIAGVLMAIVPLAVLGMAHVALPGERLTARRGVGFVAGFVGVLLLVGPGDEVAYAHGPVVPRLAILAGAFCYAVNAVLARRMPGLHPVVYGASIFTIATAVVAPLAFWIEQPFGVRAPTLAWGSALWLGVAPTAAATLGHYRLVRTAGPAFASLVSYLIPVVALAAGVMLLGEALELGAVVALALILGGIAWSESGARRSLPAPRSAADARPAR